MSMPKFKTFDVRPLLARGEEPFRLIRARVDALKPGHGVTVVAPFMPAPLIELLKSEGFESTLERGPNGSWSTKVWRSDRTSGAE